MIFSRLMMILRALKSLMGFGRLMGEIGQIWGFVRGDFVN